ncbi:hypothetical protein EAH68_11105 [Corynebacterium hylobatis]|uniref:Uncharacterized protein n=1 Tax=Corynebacterium hylobatis TaxID=1859290 RepID=A0A430HWC0_9CORY|nr:hypothetical protein [Corynebacterium hylobatis]RSZ61812.1 hypothetical protein EAH68_11105 [Corynebacterium hylobatis]
MPEKSPRAMTTAADVQWLRSRRRLATTEAEHTAVRARMMQLARDLEKRETPVSPMFWVLGGVAVIGLGLLLGVLIFQLADAMWSSLNS